MSKLNSYAMLLVPFAASQDNILPVGSVGAVVETAPAGNEYCVRVSFGKQGVHVLSTSSVLQPGDSVVTTEAITLIGGKKRQVLPENTWGSVASVTREGATANFGSPYNSVAVRPGHIRKTPKPKT